MLAAAPASIKAEQARLSHIMRAVVSSERQRCRKRASAIQYAQPPAKNAEKKTASSSGECALTPRLAKSAANKTISAGFASAIPSVAPKPPASALPLWAAVYAVAVAIYSPAMIPARDP
jgi:exonuclease VII large subunit